MGAENRENGKISYFSEQDPPHEPTYRSPFIKREPLYSPLPSLVGQIPPLATLLDEASQMFLKLCAKGLDGMLRITGTKKT